MSSPFDCHIYALRSEGQVALIDAGSGLGMDDVVAELREDGLDPAAVRSVFVTHYHADHAGSLAAWKSMTGARVYASRESAPAIRTADAEVIGLARAQQGGFYPADYVVEPCDVDVEFDDKESFTFGSLRLTAYASPGHCNGHVVFLLEGGSRTALFSGDCVFWGGTIVLQNIPDCSIPEYAATMQRLADLSFEALLPGHLTLSLRDGKRHVIAASESFRSLALPRNAVQL
jgi:glyoxylase-like metal-dependent hydrolase (beta-lactamase superfamily II)